MLSQHSKCLAQRNAQWVGVIDSRMMIINALGCYSLLYPFQNMSVDIAATITITAIIILIGIVSLQELSAFSGWHWLFPSLGEVSQMY